jgi:hypothetical protein
LAALFGEELVDAVGVKSDQNLVTDDQCRRDFAVVCPDEFEDRSLIGADVFLGKLYSSSLEDRLNGETGCSTGLGEEYHLLGFAHYSS